MAALCRYLQQGLSLFSLILRVDRARLTIILLLVAVNLGLCVFWLLISRSLYFELLHGCRLELIDESLLLMFKLLLNQLVPPRYLVVFRLRLAMDGCRLLLV
jgi:uncharacterized membrane protein